MAIMYDDFHLLSKAKQVIDINIFKINTALNKNSW